MIESGDEQATGDQAQERPRLGRFTMDMGRRPRIQRLLVVLWLTLTAASVGLAGVTWHRFSRHVDRGVELAEFNDALERTFGSLLDAETGARGFLITGGESYLEPYEDAVVALPVVFVDLTKLSLIDPEMNRDLVELRVQAELLMSALRESIRIRRTEGTSESAAANTDKAKVQMDTLRALVGKLRRQRQNIFTRHGDAIRRQLNRANLTSLFAGVIGLGTGVFAIYLTRESLRQARRERELVEARLLAERRSAEKSSVLANMSHEIRTPMNAILGFSELLDGELREPRQRHYLNSIRASGDSLLQLINDILEMSKIESGVLDLHLEPTDPREICEFVRTVFSELAIRKGLRLTCDTAEDLPRALLLDRMRLRQILVNLVGNAVKFTDKGFIRTNVKSEPQPGRTSRLTLIVEVEDTGIGIPQDRLDAIFQPFVQVDNHGVRERQGTGLGLAIVRRLIELMKGTITVASVVNKGTTFHVRIPNVSVSARIPGASSVESLDGVDFDRFEASKLVVVDDNETNRDLLAGIFAGSQHQLFFGTNGREAVELVRTHHPDAILLDVRMPVLDGQGALTEIRTLPEGETVPVIAVTASSLVEDERRLRASFTGYIRKPFTRRALFNELAGFLRLRAETSPEGCPTPPLSPGPPPTTPPVDSVRQSELTATLKAMVDGEWATLRESAAVNETRAFADRLRLLGESARCIPVIRYGTTLRNHAELYAIAEMEAELQRFPALVASLDTELNLSPEATSEPRT